jgi:hypothetical protein
MPHTQCIAQELNKQKPHFFSEYFPDFPVLLNPGMLGMTSDSRGTSWELENYFQWLQW